MFSLGGIHFASQYFNTSCRFEHLKSNEFWLVVVFENLIVCNSSISRLHGFPSIWFKWHKNSHDGL